MIKGIYEKKHNKQLETSKKAEQCKAPAVGDSDHAPSERIPERDLEPLPQIGPHGG